MELYDKEYFRNLKIDFNKKEVFRKLAYFIISITFFIAWATVYPLLLLPHLSSFILLMSLGIIIPILLFVLVIQYQNSIAYAIVLGIFYISFLGGLKSLWSYMHLFQEQLNGEYIDCSCSPSHELKDRLRFLCIICLPILLMSNKIVQSKFNLERRKWIGILLGLPILALLFIYLNRYF